MSALPKWMYWVLLLCPMCVNALEGPDIYIKARASLVQLTGVGEDGRLYLGTGVALPDGSVATNCHVTQHAKRIDPFWGNSALKAYSQRADVFHDLCLVAIPDLRMPAVVVRRSRDLHVND